MTNQNLPQLKDLTLHGMKELGEIAEVLIRQDRPDHWKNELGDLCALCIKPLLDEAGLTFEYACEIGQKRKVEKMRQKLNDIRDIPDRNKCDVCGYVFDDNEIRWGGMSETLCDACHKDYLIPGRRTPI